MTGPRPGRTGRRRRRSASSPYSVSSSARAERGEGQANRSVVVAAGEAEEPLVSRLAQVRDHVVVDVGEADARRGRARRASGAARSGGGTRHEARRPSVSSRSHGIVRRASSPHSPSSPSSSPAKIIGTPGLVICRPTPTSCRSREPAIVRKRGRVVAVEDQPTSGAGTATGHRRGTPASSPPRPRRRVAASRPAARSTGAAKSPRSHVQTGREKPA